MEKTALILGAGTAGTIVANRLVDRLGSGWTVVVVDPSDRHVFQPDLVHVPFGGSTEGMVRPRVETLAAGVHLREGAVSQVAPDLRTVYLTAGAPISYDLLVIASGARLRPDLTPGLLGDCWRTSVFDFYTLAGAQALRGALERFESGRLIVDVMASPIKSPVAPLEFLFLADDFLRRRGRRTHVDLMYVDPATDALPPRVASHLRGLVLDKGIGVVSGFATRSVDGEQRVVHAADGRSLHFDLLVAVPAHSGADFIVKSGLGDARGFVRTDPETLEAKEFPNVFVIGDATDLQIPKLGSVAHRQAEAVVENLVRASRGESPIAVFDGRAVEFVDTGNSRALFLDFDTPAGHPPSGFGPFTAGEETRWNHLGKVGLRWLYWNAILSGRGTAAIAPHGDGTNQARRQADK